MTSIHRSWVRLGFVAMLAVLPAVAFAASWLPRLGAEGGLNRGRLDTNNLFLNGEHWQYGGSAGLLAVWKLAPSWAIESAPAWERQVRRGTGSLTFGGTGGSSTQTMDQTVRFDRILLPVRASWRPGLGGLALEAGMAGAWLGHAGRSVVRSSGSTTPGSPARPRAQPDANIFEGLGTANSPAWTDHFRRWDAVWSAGAGWDQAIAGHVLGARFRWQQGLDNLAKSGDAVRLSSAAATVGMLW